MLVTNKSLRPRILKGPRPNETGLISRQTMPNMAYRPNFDYGGQMDNRNDLLSAIQQKFNVETREAIKMNFFEESDKKARMNRVKRTVEEIMNQRSYKLNERRSRLKQLLSDELATFESEYLCTIKSPVERAAELREKARQIKENRENEKGEFVRKKLEQKWRAECDELRLLKSKQLQAGLRIDHIRQMEEKICRERHRLEEEAMFAEMWHQDIQAKKEREDIDARNLHERNQQTVSILREQMQVLERQKEEEKQLRIENSRLIAEKQNIEKLEKEILHQKKLQAQAQRRHELDLTIKAKLINEAKLAREELSHDLKMLEESLASFQNEDEERARRKHELFEEQKQYREYLRREYEEQKQREKELDRIIDEEIEKQFQKRLNQWKAEKQARKALLGKVLQERQLQINEKLSRNKEKEKQLEQEKIELNKMIEFYKQQEKKEHEDLIKKNRAYGNDLVQQIGYNQLQKKNMRDQNDMDNDYYAQYENGYQNKLTDAIKSLNIKNEADTHQRAHVSGFCTRCRKDFNDYNVVINPN